MNRDELGVAGRQACDQAHNVEWTTPPDEGAILHLCRCEDEAARPVELIQEQGAVAREPIVAPKGNVVGHRWVSHPSVAELRRLDGVLLKLRGSLGLDPESRVKIGLELLTKPDKPDRIDEIIEKRRQRLAGISQGANGGGWPGSHNGHKR